MRNTYYDYKLIKKYDLVNQKIHPKHRFVKDFYDANSTD